MAVGGGSIIDTAKAADPYASHPAEFLAYVNPPIGEWRPVPGKMAPLIAIPTTADMGSEITGAVVFDFVDLRAKTPSGSAWRARRWASSIRSTALSRR